MHVRECAHSCSVSVGLCLATSCTLNTRQGAPSPGRPPALAVLSEVGGGGGITATLHDRHHCQSASRAFGQRPQGTCWRTAAFATALGSRAMSLCRGFLCGDTAFWGFLRYILLIMLLQLSYFFLPCIPLHLAPQLPPAFSPP